MMPGLVGRQVVLYTQPSDQYQLPLYNLPSGPIDNNSTVQGLLNSPDFQTILPAEYFKIGVQSLGTDTEGDWWNGWTVYYPTVNYLLRFIFGVYGTHTYVWTVQTAIQQGYNATANYQVPPHNGKTEPRFPRSLRASGLDGIFGGKIPGINFKFGRSLP